MYMHRGQSLMLSDHRTRDLKKLGWAELSVKQNTKLDLRMIQKLGMKAEAFQAGGPGSGMNWA